MHTIAPAHGYRYFCTCMGDRLTLGTSHFAAALCAFATGLDAIFHITDLFAALGTGLADLGANLANVVVEGGTTQQEIGRRLTDFGAVDH
ncbi:MULTISPECIES: hypothetical protein [Pseudomonas]|uniref:Uncharacterized protein n=1 Tax=Pseudomonas proteolytica TaxID=219574 RepID=A0AAW5A1S8_9PSED|nr:MULTISPECIES: hypothetical protein [Pseudomonas]MCF5056495.1 hypothetical protein [Pseudomonas proteolytica]MCF5101610.1 hypothetical protein [Pseudomonas proteolytica]